MTVESSVGSLAEQLVAMTVVWKDGKMVERLVCCLAATLVVWKVE